MNNEYNPEVEVIITENLSSNDKNQLCLIILLSIILSFIPALLAWFLKIQFSTNGEKIFLKHLNFQLVWGVLTLTVNIIPLLGQLTAFILFICNLCFCIKAIKAINNNENVEYPINVSIIR